MSEEHACYACGRAGSVDDICDHIVGLADGGSDDRRNLGRICRECHKRKTGREAQRGRR